MSLPAIFDLCEPNADVRTGTSSDSDFADDLSRVIRGTGGPVEYRGSQCPPFGLTLRAIQHYEVGTRGIPRVTELACWAREQGAQPGIFQPRPTTSL
jgi:hypothetical protein